MVKKTTDSCPTPRRRAVCSGDAYEMGVAQGAALRREMIALREAYAQFETVQLLKPWWLPFPLFLRLAEYKARSFLKAPLLQGFSDMDLRLRGLADGAGVRRETIYLMNFAEVMLASTEECTTIPPLGGCSAVALRGRRSVGEEPIIAHNFDYLKLVRPFYVIRESRPAGGFRSLEFTAAPLVGAVDGINEKGLCITNNYGFTTDRQMPGPTMSMLVAAALARFETVADASQWMSGQPRWGGGILMLADATGDIASLELSGTRSHLRRPAEGEHAIFHTNAYRGDSMKAVEVDDRAVFNDRAPKALRGTPVHESSHWRDERLTLLLDGDEAIDPDGLAELMADHGPNGQATENTVCMHSDYWHTTACLQLFPRSRRLRVSYTSACEAQYCEFGL